MQEGDDTIGSAALILL